MKELEGRIDRWDKDSQTGTINGDDGNSYEFSKKHWKGDDSPEAEGWVRFILENGRDVSEAEHIYIEPWMFLGHGRMYYDARAWLETARVVHEGTSNHDIEDLMGMLHQSPPANTNPHVISYRGSVVTYCYGISIEIYLKWLLTKLKIDYREDHRVAHKFGLLPSQHRNELRAIYGKYWASHRNGFMFFEIDTSGRRETGDDWSTLDCFLENIDRHKFITGRYATPESYSVVRSISTKLQREMNRYMASAAFFEVARELFSYTPFEYGPKVRIMRGP